MTPLSSQSWSNASRVYGVQSLLGVAEADVLRGFAMDCFRRQRAGERLTGASGSKRNASTTERVTLGDPSCRAGAMASLLSTAERVISELTGLPVHEGEEPLMLTHQRPGRAAAWLDGSRVHHDRINALRETREVTVLAYLSTVDDAEGGHTIFPTLRRRVDGAMDGEARAADGTLSTDATDEGEDTSVDLGAMARIVEATYHRGTRSLGCNECSMQAQVPPTADELRGEATVQRHAEAECKRALNGERHARSLAVRPQAGLAVVFGTCRPTARPRTPTCARGPRRPHGHRACRAAEVQDANGGGRSRTSRAGRAAMAASVSRARERRHTEAARLT